jgi:uncharacterized membrane protein YGL010W
MKIQLYDYLFVNILTISGKAAVGINRYLWKMKTNAIRPIQRYFNIYSELHTSRTNKMIHRVCVPLIIFSIFGLVWAVPFPHLRVFGKEGMVNWASFLLACSIYFYYRLSPVLSYIMLLVSFIFCGLIVFLEKMHAAQGWPEMWLICLVLFMLSCTGQFAGHRLEKRKPSLADEIRLLLIGPIWLVAAVLDKFKLKY